jgi:hypothetical protein
MPTLKPPDPDHGLMPSHMHPSMQPHWDAARAERESLFEHFDRAWVEERAIRLAERRRAAMEPELFG